MIVLATIVYAVLIDGASVPQGVFVVAGLFDLAMAETIFD